MRWFKNLFGRILNKSELKEEIKEIDFSKLNLQQILMLTESMEKISDWMKITERLYDIVFFDHGVSFHEREMSLNLLESLKNDLEKSFNKNLDATELAKSARKAWEFSESMIPKFGINSLHWLITEHSISGEKEIIAFVMQPQYAAILNNFISVLKESGEKERYRIQMIKQLILTRRKSLESNTIFIAHNLASTADPALLALFSPKEVASFLISPKDYQSARQIFVDLGLLTETTNARGLCRPKDEILNSFPLYHIKSMQDWLEEDQYVIQIKNSFPHDEMRSLVDITLIATIIHGMLSMFETLYGEETACDLMSIIRNDLKNSHETIDFAISLIEEEEELFISNINKEIQENINLNVLLSLSKASSELKLESEEELETIMGSYISASKLIGYGRSYSLALLRYKIRYLNALEHNSIIDEESLVKEFRKQYHQFGTSAKTAENLLLGEDWMGFEND